MGIGTAAAVPAIFLAQVLEVKAAVRRDGDMIEKAAARVDANARRGGKGSAVSLRVQYQKLGGRNKDVLQVLGGVDSRLAKEKLFNRRYDRRLVEKAVQDSIIDYVGPKGGAAAGKSNLYNVRDSAARVMFDRGGSRLKNHLDKAGVKISGYNTGATRMRPGMVDPRMVDPIKRR